MNRTFWRKDFTPTECLLMDALTGPNTGKVVPYSELLIALGFNNISILRQYISRLRKKIEKDPALPDLIITHRGVGYSFLANGRLVYRGNQDTRFEEV